MKSLDSHEYTDLIYKCGGIDKRTIEKFEKVSSHHIHQHAPWRAPLQNFSYRAFGGDGGAAWSRHCGASGCDASTLGCFGLWCNNTLPTANVSANMPTILALQFLNDHSLTMLHNRKPPSWARVPSSTPGYSTSSRPSVSVVSRSISLSGSSRPRSTMSPSLVCFLHK